MTFVEMFLVESKYVEINSGKYRVDLPPINEVMVVITEENLDPDNPEDARSAIEEAALRNFIRDIPEEDREYFEQTASTSLQPVPFEIASR